MEDFSYDDLPKDLLEEILSRLSVNALLVCKCVCMGWCNRIKSPSFVIRHFSRECNQDCLLFHICNTDLVEDENQFAFAMYKDGEFHSHVEESKSLSQMPTDHRADEFLGPENGIFFVVSNLNRIGLLNPAMREFKIIPPHPLDGLVRSISLIGFGLEPSSGDFKVVVVVQSTRLTFAFVYDLRSDSWKRVEAAFDVFVHGDKVNNCRILNGFKHWLVKFANRDAFSILAFNMRREKFKEKPIPDALRNAEGVLQLTEYGDSVALMSFILNTSLDFWAMGRNGSWSQIFRIEPFEDDLWLLCVWKKKELFIGSSSNTRLMVCDISTQEIRELIPETDAKFVKDCFTYKESLVSIKGDGDQADSIEDLY